MPDKPLDAASPLPEMTALAQQARQQAQAVLQKIPVVGPVAWLMMQQAATRHSSLSELEWRVIPALVLDQAKLYMSDQAPVAFVSWALLSEQAAARYAHAPHHLTPADWKSGGQVWVIDVLAPFGGAKGVLDELRTDVFPGKQIHQLAPTPAGEAKVLVWPAVAD
jgi:cytolysin-activating lysine-acyltransferase